MANIVFRGGLLPNDPSKPRLRLSPFVRAGYVPPASADYYSAVPVWGMEGNDLYGDCVFASNAHMVLQQTVLGTGMETPVTTAQTLAEYSSVTGFDPNDPSTDNGATVQQGLDDFLKNGLAGIKIAAFAQVDQSNITEVQTAVAQMGAVDVGCTITAGDMNAFNAGQPWTGGGSTAILGGHCIPLVGYDSMFLYFVTWGKVQKATYAWWNKRVDEAWAVVSSSWADAGQGNDPEGLDLQALGDEFAAMTGQPNPFTPVPPPPPPPPPPTPPDAADQTLFQATFNWSNARHTGSNKRVAAAIRAWAQAKGF